MKNIKRHHRKVKKALRKQKLPDPYFTGKYSFCPYHACEHGCLYCDGSTEKYYIQGEFDIWEEVHGN